MPKKRISSASLANLQPGVRKGQRDNKERLILRVRPETKRWLEAQPKMGEAVDALVQNQRGTGYMFGTMRLVNPWRGLVYVAQVHYQHGILSARTSDFQQFSLYAVLGGKEFFPGRKFDRLELAQWFLGEPLHPDQRTQIADEFGDIPALAPNPQSWKWYTVGGRGEERLKQQAKPSAAEMQQLAGAALMLQKEQFYPLLDPYEIWVCDKETLAPIALAMTGQTLKDIDWQTFSPMWRGNWQDAPAENESALRQLEKRVNSRINAATEAGKFRWVHRLFKRSLDGSAEEYARENPQEPSLPLLKIAEHPVGYLPEGLLAEPFESERIKLEI